MAIFDGAHRSCGQQRLLFDQNTASAAGDCGDLQSVARKQCAGLPMSGVQVQAG